MLNRVQLIGRVGKDPETKHTEQFNVSKFTLATTDKYKDKENTTWHNIVIFGKLSDVAEKWVKKGDLLYVEGSIQQGSYEKDGVKHYTHDIKVDSFKMLGSKSESKETKPEINTDGAQCKSGKDDLPF